MVWWCGRLPMGAALAAFALAACRGEAPRKPAAAGAPAAPAAPQGAPATSAASAVVPASLAPEVRTACAGVVRFWEKYDSTSVHRTDSVTTPLGSDTAVRACVVLVDQEHGMRRATRAPVDTAVRDLGLALALTRGAGPGWVRLYHYAADGADGSDLGFQRGRVRCLVEQSWDGGDDSDSTYVPADWFKEATTCWLMPHELTPSDTAVGS